MQDTPPNPTQDIAFNIEATRAGMFAAALDMLESMRTAGVQDAPAALITGSIEAATQLWAQVSKRAGVPRKKARETMEKEMRRFFAQHWDSDPEEPTEQ